MLAKCMRDNLGWQQGRQLDYGRGRQRPNQQRDSRAGDTWLQEGVDSATKCSSYSQMYIGVQTSSDQQLEAANKICLEHNAWPTLLSAKQCNAMIFLGNPHFPLFFRVTRIQKIHKKQA